MMFILPLLVLLAACSSGVVVEQNPEAQVEQTAPKEGAKPSEEVKEQAPPAPSYEVSQLWGDWTNLQPTDAFDGTLRFKRNGLCGFAPFDEIYSYKLQGDTILLKHREVSEEAIWLIVKLDNKTLELVYGENVKGQFKRYGK